jgi:hypothetical protein
LQKMTAGKVSALLDELIITFVKERYFLPTGGCIQTQLGASTRRSEYCFFHFTATVPCPLSLPNPHVFEPNV